MMVMEPTVPFNLPLHKNINVKISKILSTFPNSMMVLPFFWLEYITIITL
jgi:hypothetical protein